MFTGEDGTPIEPPGTLETGDLIVFAQPGKAPIWARYIKGAPLQELTWNATDGKPIDIRGPGWVHYFKAMTS